MSHGRRAAIFAVSAETAGIRGWLVRVTQRRYGLAPGIMRVVLTDLRVGFLASLLHDRVNFGARSLSLLHREMIATVVNGKIGGAP